MQSIISLSAVVILAARAVNIRLPQTSHATIVRVATMKITKDALYRAAGEAGVEVRR